jgi:uncharacterized membrane protein (UPF0127 family)
MKNTGKNIVQIVNPATGQVIIESARWCKGSLCKFIGFQFRSHLRVGETLILVHKRDSVTGSAIHMFFVFTSLGVIWVNSKNYVTHMQVAKPWRPHYASPTPACFVIETEVGNLEQFKVGDLLEFKSSKEKRTH